ncbi:unnamed protein product [Closterium sp. NIES-65]|nr:unnamed protein product [Closterium sp. NIES-65]
MERACVQEAHRNARLLVEHRGLERLEEGRGEIQQLGGDGMRLEARGVEMGSGDERDKARIERGRGEVVGGRAGVREKGVKQETLQSGSVEGTSRGGGRGVAGGTSVGECYSAKLLEESGAGKERAVVTVSGLANARPVLDDDERKGFCYREVGEREVAGVAKKRRRIGTWSDGGLKTGEGQVEGQEGQAQVVKEEPLTLQQPMVERPREAAFLDTRVMILNQKEVKEWAKDEAQKETLRGAKERAREGAMGVANKGENEGAMEGATEGATEGTTEGTTEGAMEGAREGGQKGTMDGGQGGEEKGCGEREELGCGEEREGSEEDLYHWLKYGQKVLMERVYTR